MSSAGYAIVFVGGDGPWQVQLIAQERKYANQNVHDMRDSRVSLTALADDGHGNKGNNGNNGNSSSFESSVMGSVPGLAVAGVGSGGAPWVVQTGETSISPRGQVHVEVHGLLIGQGGPPNLVGTTGPVTMVGATLICGGAGSTPVPACRWGGHSIAPQGLW